MTNVLKRIKMSLETGLARKADHRDPTYLEKMSQRWDRGRSRELRFWRRFTGGIRHPDELRRRLDPEQPLQDYVTRWLDPSSSAVSILDVGAGPLSVLGRHWAGHTVEFTAVDALADEYSEMLNEFGITDPPVPTLPCPTEALVERFGPERFDLVHARNTLDHHADPLLAIKCMLTVTRAGGYVVMQHYSDEARKACYGGLHQWNFRVAEGDLSISNREVSLSLSEHIRGDAEILDLDPADGTMANVVMRKLTRVHEGVERVPCG